MKKYEHAYQSGNPMLYEILKQHAQKMRYYPTDAESALWSMLRNNSLGVSFRRQHIIMDFIVDFVCLAKKLVIEVDGGYHSKYEQQISDRERDSRLRAMGYRVLRFTNEQVLVEMENTIKTISAALHQAEGNGVTHCAGIPPLWGDGRGALFLYRIAERFWQEQGEEVSKLSFVFPNRRTGLFFQKHLATIAGKPLFAPRILTINQLFEELSPLQQADNIDLLFRLYDVYRTERNDAEPFDKFLFWGRMMLSDFNEIDQHLVDAQALYTNLRDLKAIDERFAALSEEQTASVQAFLRNMHGTTSEYKKRFFSIWNSLLPIYTRFRESLRQDGIAYTGMLQREVVSRAKDGGQRTEDYVFIGFNALTGVERALMEQLRDAGKADFYWDYEAEWLRDPNNRASMFYEQNTQAFPSKYVLRIHHPSSLIPQIHWLRIPSAVGQADEVRKILASISAQMDWTQVGVVLPNENLLQPIRYAIPEQIAHVNITMGQSLRQTSVYSLLLHLSELLLTPSPAMNLYYKPVLALLHHPYVQAMAADEATALQARIIENNWVYIAAENLNDYPFLQRLLTLPSALLALVEHLRDIIITFATEASLDKIEQEYLYQTMLILNRVERLLQMHPAIPMERKTLLALIIQLVESQTVPFEGEPLLGLQIMGVLESRGMDFRTLIITDVNEETLPGKTQQNTYIPYDLRLYFGLPTAERQDAIFAYNFYRLIAQAENVYLLQNTVANEISTGEVSRYVYQLKYQYNLPLTEIDVNSIPSVTATQPIQIDKSPAVMQQITNVMRDKGIAPTTLNTYVACPLRFYWQTICRNYEAATIAEDVEANTIGLTLHKVMEILYGKPDKPYKVAEQDIIRFVQRVEKTSLVEDTYREQAKLSSQQLSARDTLAVHVVKRYLKHILNYDRKLCAHTFFYHDSECPLQTYITLTNGQQVLLKGTIDRIDSIDGNIRIIDYKTGGVHAKDLPLEELYVEQTKPQAADHYRQTLMYALLYALTHEHQDSKVVIYYARNKQDEIENELLSSFAEVAGFQQTLVHVLDEIFDHQVPFVQRIDKENTCKYCPFTAICGVKV